MTVCDAGCSGVYWDTRGGSVVLLALVPRWRRSPNRRSPLRINGIMTRVVKWVVLPDGHWMERCVRHAPAAVREWLDGPGELPAFVEVREVTRREFTCPACWAETMKGAR